MYQTVIAFKHNTSYIKHKLKKIYQISQLAQTSLPYLPRCAWRRVTRSLDLILSKEEGITLTWAFTRATYETGHLTEFNNSIKSQT